MARLVLFFARLIPRRTGIWFFRVLGLALYYLMANRRKTSLINMEIAFKNELDKKERIRIAKESMMGSATIAFDFLKILQMPRTEQGGVVEIIGEENLRNAVRMNRGVVAVSAHFGNFPLMLALMSSRGFRVNVVTRRIRAEWADRLYTGMLNHFGTGTITKEKVAVGIIRALKKGEIVGYVLDQNMQKGTGIFVDFFGIKASTIRGLGTFASRYGSPILPAYIVSTQAGHKIIIEKPYFYDAESEDETILTQRFTSIIESWIRKYPEQWLWSHRRFKTRPPGEERVYPVKPSFTKRFRRWKRKRP